MISVVKGESNGCGLVSSAWTWSHLWHNIQNYRRKKRNEKEIHVEGYFNFAFVFYKPTGTEVGRTTLINASVPTFFVPWDPRHWVTI